MNFLQQNYIRLTFKYIRNRIRESEPNSLIREILVLLKESEQKNLFYIPVWNVLLLLKWTFEFSEQRFNSKVVGRNEIIKLLKCIQDLQDENNYFVKHPEEGVTKLINILSHQQYFLQQKVWKDTFLRQAVLFIKLQSNYSITEKFESVSHISIENFLKLSFILYTYINPYKHKLDFDYNGRLNSDFFKLVFNYYDKATLQAFLRLLTFPSDNGKEIIKNFNKVKSYDLQPFEITIFTNFPLIIFDDEYYVIHKNIFNYTVNYFVYDYMKSIDNERFSEEFGRRLEKYVEIGLKEIKLEYKKEKQLRKEFQGKVVDYLVNDNILIECKAIEIEPYPNIYPDGMVFYNWLKKSLVKAYFEQMFSVVSQIEDIEEFYGIIITYKETHFSNGIDAWDLFLKDNYTNNEKNEKTLRKIPPDNLFFIDIECWDRIVLIINERKATLREILTNAKEDNKDSNTKKGLFSLHLNKYDSGPVNQSYLNINENIFDQIV